MKETKSLLEKKVHLAEQEIARLENQIIESDNFLTQLSKDVIFSKSCLIC